MPLLYLDTPYALHLAAEPRDEKLRAHEDITLHYDICCLYAVPDMREIEYYAEEADGPAEGHGHISCSNSLSTESEPPVEPTLMPATHCAERQ